MEEKGIQGQKARVVACVDFSGSMYHLYHDGHVQETLERLIPIALNMDDDGSIELYLFHQNFYKLSEALTRSNAVGYINNKVLNNSAYRMGTTNYAPVINQIVKDFGNPVQKSGSFFGSDAIQPAAIPTFVIFIADGGCDDKSSAEAAVKEASKHGIFFQFIGIGGANFSFLEKLDDLKGRNIDNADFFAVQNLSAMSDNDLYTKLMTEYPAYVPQARAKGLIV